MNQSGSQLDRRSFIASAGAAAFALALEALPAETVPSKDSIIVSPNGGDDAPGNLAHLRSLGRALALGRSRGKSTILLRTATHTNSSNHFRSRWRTPRFASPITHKRKPFSVAEDVFRLNGDLTVKGSSELPFHQALPLTNSSSTIDAK